MKPNLNDLMKQAKMVQEKMQEAQRELESMEVTGEAGGGLVKISMTGRHQVKKVHIDDELLDEQKSMLEDLIAAACNDAVRKIEKATRGKMANLSSGFNLGDLGNLE